MTYLALTAAVSMSISDPQFDLPQDYAIGTPLATEAPAPTDIYYDASPRNPSLAMRRREQALQDSWQPSDEALPEDEWSYDEEPIPENGEYWTFDGSGTVPLRYGVQTDEGRYEYDLSRDEITFRLPGW